METGQNQKIRSELQYSNRIFRNVAYFANIPNTFNKLVDIAGKGDCDRTTRGIRYCKFDNNRLFISFAHPEARVQDSLLYYGLIDAIKEIMSA